MIGKGIVSGRRREAEWYELGGKIGKNTEGKNHRAHNLEKLNDAKCPFLIVFYSKGICGRREK